MEAVSFEYLAAHARTEILSESASFSHLRARKKSGGRRATAHRKGIPALSISGFRKYESRATQFLNDLGLTGCFGNNLRHTDPLNIFVDTA